MWFRTSEQLGMLCRNRRRELGLTQAAVADQAGVSRQWISALENGGERLEIGLILQVVESMGLQMELYDPRVPYQPPTSPRIDLDEVLAAVREGT